MKKLLIGLILICAGCRKQTGPKGDRGEPGIIINYVGVITSDNQGISIPEYGENSNISVYIKDGNGLIELPFFTTILNTNVFYLASLHHVQIYMAQSAGALSYRVTIINEN